MSTILDKLKKGLNNKAKENPLDKTKKEVAQRSTLISKTGASKLKVITKKDELPRYASVLGSEGSGIILPPDIAKQYAILLTNQERKEVVIICSTETRSYISSEPDMDYLTIAQSVSRGGFIRRGQNKLFATPEILSIIYDNEKTGMSAEEQKRTATKIQLDFDELLVAALDHGTSDIHIEVRRNQARVRFRKNGDMYDYQEWSVTHARTMAGVIYQVIADEKDTSFDESRPQDALIDRNLGDNIQLRVRLATIPAYPSGFDMIMRILKMGQDGTRQSLDQLGYEKTHLTSIRRAVSKPVGAVIMAGTTGSGKSTSLNSMLGEKIEQYRGTIKVITIEDPPEYALPGATQVPVVRSRSKAQAGNMEANPFASVVRAAMRSDPDILMVGEIRDEDSAELLIHAVQSGHQVFTTVHAGSGIDIISRLRSNGIPDDVLGGQNFISALMFQSLIPVLCPHCAIDINNFSKIVESDQDQDCIDRIYKYVKPSLIANLRFENSDGCKHCSSGRIGRSVASEVILPDPYMLSCFRNKQDTDAFMHYRRRGGKIALEHGLLKALRGQMDVRMVESKLDQITGLDELHISMLTFDNKDINKEPPFQIDENIFTGIEIPVATKKQGKSDDIVENRDSHSEKEAAGNKSDADDTDSNDILEIDNTGTETEPAVRDAEVEKKEYKSKTLGGVKSNKKAPVIEINKDSHNKNQNKD